MHAHTHTQWLPDISKSLRLSRSPGSHSLTTGLPSVYSLLWADQRRGNAAPSSLTPPLSRTPQGSQYWRFDDGALDPGYPRDISEGFEGIPNDIDAAFALPAHSYHGNERVYFFKGKGSCAARAEPGTSNRGQDTPLTTAPPRVRVPH